MGWGKEWPSLGCIPPKTELIIPNDKLFVMRPDGLKECTNLKPTTHDPYTNLSSYIYYQCNCGAVLDPGTRSFAALNNAASLARWKIRFGEVGYTPYCVKCGEGVE